MRAVYKYPVPFGDEFDMQLPEGAEVLTLQMQHGRPCLWALVRPDAPLVTRRFRMAGTGHPIGDKSHKHIGSFQLEGGALVFHLFETVP